jgi:3-hydroxy-9,10-secoandrosta-1,3,5(10)-triene-9,17-dione monooxygenase reductase component
MSTNTLFDKKALRSALGTFGTGVTIVSCAAQEKGPIGLTANSFNSVSLDPPVVLWSLQKTSPSLSAFDACGRFVINVLALDQIELSRRFSSAIPDKFSGVEFRTGIEGLPVLEGCAANFECKTIQRLEVGDHVLFLGQIEAYAHKAQATLLYVQGHYAKAGDLTLQPA